jgi:3-hydroxyisobutyrate dehydrogenase
LTATVNTNTRIGWIGTGVMGQSMCGHLIAAGYPATIYSRTRAKAEPLLAAGAVWADSPRAVAASADVVFTMVGFPQDVRDVYFAADGILAGANAGAVFVDMTTTEPTLAREIHARATGAGANAVDAPVSGGDVGARNRALSIMVGGDADAVARVMPLFEILGKNIVHQGGPGAGQHTKMCNQIVIAGTMIGVCESLVYAFKAQLNPELMLQSIRSGAAGCWTLENLAPRVLKGNFEPGFIVEHFIKDMGIALSEAQRMGLAMPGLALVHQLYNALQAQGHGRRGTQALVLALEHISNVPRRPPAG